MGSQAYVPLIIVDPRVSRALRVSEMARDVAAGVVKDLSDWMNDRNASEAQLRDLIADSSVFSCTPNVTDAKLERLVKEMTRLKAVKAVHKVTTVWPVLPLLSEGAVGPWLPVPTFAHDDLSPHLIQELKREDRSPNYDAYSFNQPMWDSYYDCYSNFKSTSNLWRSMHQLTQYPGETRLEAVGFLGPRDSLIKAQILEGVVIRIRHITRLHDTDEMFEGCHDLTLEEWILEGKQCTKFGCHSMAAVWWHSLDTQIWATGVKGFKEILTRVRHQMPTRGQIKFGPMPSAARQYVSGGTVETLPQEALKQDDECIICRMELSEASTEGEDGRPIRFACPGSHQYHASCLLRYLETDHNTCPLCIARLFDPLHKRDRRSLSCEEMREVTGVPFSANQRWRNCHVKYAADRYFSIPTNRHGLFSNFSPDLPNAIIEIFVRLAKLNKSAIYHADRSEYGGSWDHWYRNAYMTFVACIRKTLADSTGPMKQTEFEDICQTVDKAKLSRICKDEQDALMQDRVSVGFNSMTAPPRDSLAKSRAAFYAEVMQAAPRRVAQQVVRQIAGHYGNVGQLFAHVDLEEVRTFVIHDVPELRLGHAIRQPSAQGWSELTNIHNSHFLNFSRDDRQNRQTLWNCWLRLTWGLTPAVIRPEGYFAPMKGLTLDQSCVSESSPNGDKTPHSSMAMAYARRATLPGVTRSGRCFRSTWVKLALPMSDALNALNVGMDKDEDGDVKMIDINDCDDYEDDEDDDDDYDPTNDGIDEYDEPEEYEDDPLDIDYFEDVPKMLDHTRLPFGEIHNPFENNPHERREEHDDEGDDEGDDESDDESDDEDSDEDIPLLFDVLERDA